MGVGQLSESDAVDALRLPFYSSSHPTGSHGWRNQFDLGNPDLDPLNTELTHRLDSHESDHTDRLDPLNTELTQRLGSHEIDHIDHLETISKSEPQMH